MSYCSRASLGLVAGTDTGNCWYLVKGELPFSKESSRASAIALVVAESCWYTAKGELPFAGASSKTSAIAPTINPLRDC